MKLKLKLALACALIVAGAFGSAPSNAATLYDNISPSPVSFPDPTGSDGSDAVAGPFGIGPLYNSFSTGSASSYSLSQITLMLSGDPTSNSLFSIGIYNNDPSAPAASPPGNAPAGVGPAASPFFSTGPLADNSIGLLGLGVPTTPAGATPVTLAFSPQTLAGSTRYWIGLSSVDGTSVNWVWTVDASGTGVAGEYFSNQNSTFAAADGGPYQMLIQADAVSNVPLPATLPMFAAGLGVVGLLARRRNRMLAS
jgi:hypothetical protein